MSTNVLMMPVAPFCGGDYRKMQNKQHMGNMKWHNNNWKTSTKYWIYIMSEQNTAVSLHPGYFIR